jgi:tetratricopeptide (TPR) repeat protein
MLPSFLVFGCGRGAFESAYPAFRVDTGHLTFTHPENVVAQWMIEWGAPVAIMAFVAIATALRPSRSWGPPGPVQGAWAGLLALAIQNLGDLGSEVPAVALAAVVCAAIVVGGAPGRRLARVVGWSRRPRSLALVVGFCAVAALALATVGRRGELQADRKGLHDAALERHVTTDEMHTLAREAMLRHPAEPYLPFMTALRASRERDDDGVPWIEATLERAPVYAPAHLVLARLVVPRSRSQARLEYRIAMEQESSLVGTVMAEAPRVVASYDDAAELVPRGWSASGVVEILAGAIRARLPATARRLDRLLAVYHSSASAMRTAEDAVRDVEFGHGAPWCRDADAKARCVSFAIEMSDEARSLSPNECAGHALLARARIAAGGAQQALADLETAAEGVEDRESCLETLVVLARGAGDVGRAEHVLDRIASFGCRSSEQCAQTLRWVSAQEEAVGDVQRAFAVCRHGLERVPEDVELLACSARLAARAGLHAEAAQDYAELVRRRPDNVQWREDEVAERAAAMKGVVQGR